MIYFKWFILLPVLSLSLREEKKQRFREKRKDPPDHFPLRHRFSELINLQKKKTWNKCMNAQNRRWCCLCGDIGHYCHSCTQRKAEGVGDGASDGEKIWCIQDPTRLEDEGDPHSAACCVWGPPMIISRKMMFRAIPHHRMMRDHHLVLTLEQESQNRKIRGGVFSIYFLTWKQRYYPGQKLYYWDGFNNDLTW